MTETQQVITSIKDMAREAYRQGQQREAEAAARRQLEDAKTAKRIFSEMFGVEPESVEGWTVVHEGDTFRCFQQQEEYRNWDTVLLVNTCPECGQEFSTAVYSVERYGELLEDPPKHPRYECDRKDTPPVETPAERLASALQEFIGAYQ